MAKRLLILVDVQKDFDKGGVLPYGYPEESNTGDVVGEAIKWKYQKQNNILWLTKDTHDENYSETLEGKLLPVPHCIKGTDGWKFVDEDVAQPQPPSFTLSRMADKVILKRTFGTFEIVQQIKNLEDDSCEFVDEIILCGYDLSICVLSNAVILRAAFPNKRIVVLKDACGDVNKESFDAALTVLKNQQIEIV